MSDPVPVSGGVGDLAARARRYWPVGVGVAVVVAIVGLVLIWEAPRVYVSRAAVYPPATVASAAAGLRYAADLEAAVNSATVQADVAEKLGVPRSAFGDHVELRRVRQSAVMDAVMTSPDRLDDPGAALSALLARAGQSLSAPDVAAAQAQQEQAQEELAQAEDGAVDAKGMRDAYLRDRGGVSPALELDILGPELAQLRLCASGAVVPDGADAAACRAQAVQLQDEADELAVAADELAALDRGLERAEATVSTAQQALDDAEAAIVRAGLGPVVEVSQAGNEVSRVPGLLRRSLAVIAGALLLGLAAAGALALLSERDRRSSAPGASGRSGSGRSGSGPSDSEPSDRREGMPA